MSKLISLATHVSEANYNKMWQFLEQYNEKTGENLTMSQLVWKAIKFFVNHTFKSWKG